MPISKLHVVASDGVVIMGEAAGDPRAPTVVLLHGAGQTRHSWDAARKALAESGCYVIAYDARGHGESGWSADGVYSYALRASDLRSVLVGASEPVALVGASMGGITSMQAITDGLRPSALVLVDIVLRPDRRGVARIRDFMRASPAGFANIEEAADAVAAYNPNRPRSKDPSGLMRNLRAAADGRLYWHWDPRILPPNLEDDMASMERLIEGMRVAPKQPTLLVRGAQSDVVSEAGVAEFRGLLPDIDVFDVAAAGHMVAGDSNDRFNHAIIEFLDRHLPPRTGAPG
jgi:pimeloyl-ACP methyl ester carboxylesterase